MITIIDYGMGNLRSVEKIFHRLNIPVQLSADHDEILKAEKLVLPGVGHFSHGMKQLETTGLKKVLTKKVIDDKTPILGICLGMQLMTKHSEEGDQEGLGWVDANTCKFNFETTHLKIPHMGWNTVSVKKHTILSEGIDQENLFYFVHSYFVKCNKEENVLFETNYGTTFTSGFEKDNIIGVQFHPEKSHQSGMRLIQNFLNK